MIPIALSYRIIKNTQPADQQERKLESLDVSEFRKKNDERYLVSDEEENDNEDYLTKIRREVRHILRQEMEDERQALMIEAKVQIEKDSARAKEEAYREGFEEGFLKGKEEGYEETLTFRQNAMEMLNDAEEMARDYLEANEEKIIRLSAKIAEKIVQVTLHQSDESIMLLARPILQEYGKTENVIITCHPGKVEFMKAHTQEIQKMCPNAHILILQDKNLEECDMVIENESQITDLTISRQIARFIELATE